MAKPREESESLSRSPTCAPGNGRHRLPARRASQLAHQPTDAGEHHVERKNHPAEPAHHRILRKKTRLPL